MKKTLLTIVCLCVFIGYLIVLVSINRNLAVNKEEYTYAIDKIISTPRIIEVQHIEKESELTYERLFDELEYVSDEELEDWFIRYQKWSNIYDSDRDTIEYFFTEDEIQLMLQVIETETYQATFIQKVNVANVLINRWSLGCFGGDMTEIITAPNQFTYDRTEISNDTINALNFAFEIRDTTNGSVAFRSDKNAPHTSNFELEMYDGIHWFYKFKEDEL